MLGAAVFALPAAAQVGPSVAEISAYRGLHAAAHSGDAAQIERLARSGADLHATDSHGRTPLHVATFAGNHDAIRALARAGANLNLLEKVGMTP